MLTLLGLPISPLVIVCLLLIGVAFVTRSLCDCNGVSFLVRGVAFYDGDAFTCFYYKGGRLFDYGDCYD